MALWLTGSSDDDAGQQAAYALSTAVYDLCLNQSKAGPVPNCFTVQVFFKSVGP